jgi:hypothetical protein
MSSHASSAGGRTSTSRRPSGLADHVPLHRQHGTVSMFERHGLERTRRIGKHHWVVSKVVG